MSDTDTINNQGENINHSCINDLINKNTIVNNNNNNNSNTITDSIIVDSKLSETIIKSNNSELNNKDMISNFTLPLRNGAIPKVYQGFPQRQLNESGSYNLSKILINEILKLPNIIQGKA